MHTAHARFVMACQTQAEIRHSRVGHCDCAHLMPRCQDALQPLPAGHGAVSNTIHKRRGHGPLVHMVLWRHAWQLSTWSTMAEIDTSLRSEMSMLLRTSEPKGKRLRRHVAASIAAEWQQLLGLSGIAVSIGVSACEDRMLYIISRPGPAPVSQACGNVAGGTTTRASVAFAK